MLSCPNTTTLTQTHVLWHDDITFFLVTPGWSTPHSLHKELDSSIALWEGMQNLKGPEFQRNMC